MSESPSALFISYRRTDNPDATGRLYDRLVSEFGKARVFKDVDSIPLGQDFRSHLNGVVGGCAAVLAIIGPKWTEIQDSKGRRRLEDPDDFVRIELEAALARSIPVVPVLVGHAAMPAAHDLPASLSSLAYRQSIEVRPDPDFHNDATRLVAALRKIVDPNAPEQLAQPAAPPIPAAATAGNRKMRAVWPLAVAGLVIAAALALQRFGFLEDSPPAEVRTEIVTPPSQRPLDIALSPDGKRIAFVATESGVSRLWLRSLDSQDARPMRGTEGAMLPFWSPDSHSIAYFTPTGLARVDVDGSRPASLLNLRFNKPGGGAWNADGVIIFSGGAGGIYRLDPGSEQVKPITRPQAAQLAHVSPCFLPDGKRFLFMAAGSPSQAGLYLATLDGAAPVRIAGEFLAFDLFQPDWLVFLRGGALMAQRLDLKAADLVGEAVLLTQLSGKGGGLTGYLSVSDNGMIALRTAPVGGRQLRWYNRRGEPLGTVGEVDETMSNPRVSPDGRRVLIDREVNSNTDIWMLDGVRETRLTYETEVDARPIWLPNGREFVFYSLSNSKMDLFIKSSEGAGGEVKLLPAAAGDALIRVPVSTSADGRQLLYFESTGKPSLHVVNLQGERKPWTWLETPFNVLWGSFSPDGRWIAYVADDTGSREIYVRPFAAQGASRTFPPGIQWPISAQGGNFPIWSPDSKEIYFLSPDGDLMASRVSATASSFDSTPPEKLFSTRVYGRGIEQAQGRQYDVAPDGRFLINEELGAGETLPISLIQNWNPRRAAAR